MTVTLIFPHDIGGLGAEAFNTFVGDLVWLEAVRRGIHPSKIVRTDKTTAKDGGIDLEVLDSVPAASWLPLDKSGWQFKSGVCPSPAQLAGTAKKVMAKKATNGKKAKSAKQQKPTAAAKLPEFRKPQVYETVAKNRIYVFVTAADITPKKNKDIEKAFVSVHGKKARILVLGGSDLARWASELPAVSASHFPRVGWLTKWYPYEVWDEKRASKYLFRSDSVRDDMIRDIRAAIAKDDRFLHLAGSAGVGKTRLVLESCRQPELCGLTLYLEQQVDFDPSVVAYASAAKMKAILVVDECEDIETLRKRAEHLPSGCIIIAIGHQQSALTTFRLPGLAPLPLAQMLRDRVPLLSEEETKRIVARCGDSPKLVNFLADNPPSDWSAIEQSDGIREWLELAYPFSGDDQRRVMYAICLFGRVGRERPHEEETTTLAAWLDMHRGTFSGHVEALLAKGILSPRGYSVYPTPDVLANVLARKGILGFGSRDILELLKKMPQRAKESFAERLQQVGAGEWAADFEEVLYGPKGLFRDAKVLSDGELAAVARISATAFARAAVLNYSVLLDALSDEKIAGISGAPRRELVWALEALAWLPDTFQSAGRLLKRLALSENETYANNATGCFLALFRPILGATSAPYELRLPLLEEMKDGRPGEQTLLVSAIEKGIELSNITRSGGPPEVYGKTLDEWNPPRAVHADIVRQLLALLRALIENASPTIQAQAAQALSKDMWGLVFSGLYAELSEAVGVLAGRPFALREPVLERARALLHYHSKQLSQDARRGVDRILETLGPSNVAERLRTEVARWPEEPGLGPSRDVQLMALAKEFLSVPEHRDEGLRWLLSGEASSAWQFGESTAAVDSERKLLARIEDEPLREVADDRFLGGYLFAVAAGGEAQLVDGLLDRWSTDPQRAVLAASLTHRLGYSPRGLRRLAKMIEDDLLPGGFIYRLTMGFYCRDAPGGDVALLVSASSHDPSDEAKRARLHLLNQYIGHHRGDQALNEQLRAAVIDVVGVEWNTMDEYVWGKAIGLCCESGTVEYATLVFEALQAKEEMRDLSASQSLRARLTGAISGLGEDVRWEFFLERIGPALVGTEGSADRLIRRRIGKHLLDLFDPEKVISWVSQDVKGRLWRVAGAASVNGIPMPQLARQLLKKWGHRREVFGALSASFGTGSWSGPASDYYRSRVDLLRKWEEDHLPQVKAFAHQLRQVYERQVKDAEKQEEERGY